MSLRLSYFSRINGHLNITWLYPVDYLFKYAVMAHWLTYTTFMADTCFLDCIDLVHIKNYTFLSLFMVNSIGTCHWVAMENWKLLINRFQNRFICCNGGHTCRELFCLQIYKNILTSWNSGSDTELNLTLTELTYKSTENASIWMSNEVVVCFFFS